MAQVDFKSVGIREFKDNVITSTESVNYIGIKTPLEFGSNSEGVFGMHTALENQIQDNFRNLLLTNHGERLALYDLGANLKVLTTEFSSQDDFDGEAVIRIKTTTSKYMPYVDLDSFESFIDRHNNRDVAKIRIRITYNIPMLNIRNKKIEVTIFAI